MIRAATRPNGPTVCCEGTSFSTTLLGFVHGEPKCFQGKCVRKITYMAMNQYLLIPFLGG